MFRTKKTQVKNLSKNEKFVNKKCRQVKIDFSLKEC